MSVRSLHEFNDRFHIHLPQTAFANRHAWTQEEEFRARHKQDEAGAGAHGDPPSIPRPRYACLCAVCCLSCLSCASFVVLAVFHARAAVPFERTAVRRETALASRPPETGRVVEFGAWDSANRLSALQLKLGISMAIGNGLHEEEIHVLDRGSYFFDATLDRGGESLAAAINDPSFIASVNEQLAPFGGAAVLTHHAVLRLRNHTAR